MLLIFSSSTLLAPFSASEIEIASNHSVQTGQTQKPSFLIPPHTCYPVRARHCSIRSKFARQRRRLARVRSPS
ncbi:hypothetical protein ACE6H2_010881 [Prunus campanulata]